MNVVQGKPPNWEQIVAAFPHVATRTNVLFCYKHTIFTVGRTDIHPSLIDHERVHSRRQIVEGVDRWWTRYCEDVQFRLDEELPAHRAEYERLCDGLTRNQRRVALRQVARRLCGPLYGKLVSHPDAMRMIAEGT